jgi:hypothetical protein
VVVCDFFFFTHLLPRLSMLVYRGLPFLACLYRVGIALWSFLRMRVVLGNNTGGWQFDLLSQIMFNALAHRSVFCILFDNLSS